MWHHITVMTSRLCSRTGTGKSLHILHTVQPLLLMISFYFVTSRNNWGNAGSICRHPHHCCPRIFVSTKQWSLQGCSWPTVILVGEVQSSWRGLCWVENMWSSSREDSPPLVTTPRIKGVNGITWSPWYSHYRDYTGTAPPTAHHLWWYIYSIRIIFSGLRTSRIAISNQTHRWWYPNTNVRLQ